MPDSDVRDRIAAHPFFADLDARLLDVLATCARIEAFPAGTTVFHEGGPADRLYAITEGRVALEVVAPDRDPLIVDTVQAGQVLGVSWLVPPHRWSCDALAVVPVEAVVFDGPCLHERCDADPRLGYLLASRVAAVLHGRMRSARIRLLDVYRHARAG